MAPLTIQIESIVGRDSHLDTKPSILENRPTAMIQFTQGFGTIDLNILATSSLRYPNEGGISKYRYVYILYILQMICIKIEKNYTY